MEDPTAVTPAPQVDSGVNVEPDYFGFAQTTDVYLPGSQTQYVTIKALNEGDKRRYQNLTNKDVTVQKSGDMKMKMQAGDERHALIESALVGWSLLRRNDKGVLAPVGFTKAEVSRFLIDASPKVIEHIEKEVRKLNPWTLADMSIEDIDREMANLQEMRDTKVKEEEGNASSKSK